MVLLVNLEIRKVNSSLNSLKVLWVRTMYIELLEESSIGRKERSYLNIKMLKG